MEKTYVIKWKPRLGVTHSLSKKLFSQEEAEQLAEELNQDHPEFIHEPHNLIVATVLTAAPLEPSCESSVIRNIDFTTAAKFNLPIKENALA